MLVSDMALVRGTVMEVICEVVDMDIDPGLVALLTKYPPNYSVSYLSNMIKKGSRRKFKKRFALLKKLCGYYLGESSYHHGSVGIV